MRKIAVFISPPLLVHDCFCSLLLQLRRARVYGVEHSRNQQKTEDKTGGYLARSVKDFFGATFLGSYIDEHDYEQEKHHHAAHIHEDLNTSNKLSTRQDEQSSD